MEQVNNPLFAAIFAAFNAHINQLIDAKINEYSRQVSEAIGTLEQKVGAGIDNDAIMTRVNEVIAATDTLTLISEAHNAAIKEMIGEAIDKHESEWEHNSEDSIDDRVSYALRHYDFSDAIDTALGNFDFDDLVETAIDNYDFDDKIESAIYDADFSEKIREFLGDNNYPNEERVIELAKEHAKVDEDNLHDAIVDALSGITLTVKDPTISIKGHC